MVGAESPDEMMSNEKPLPSADDAALTGGTADGESNNKNVHIQDMSAPASCCCIHWHPTDATVIMDGERYKWNARAHRKLRFMQGPEKFHPTKFHQRFRILSFEPKIITWWNIWTGMLGNILWVINGLFAVWPELTASSETISYGTGIAGGLAFLVTGYLGYVEAINQTYHDLRMPEKKKGGVARRKFQRPKLEYGYWRRPVCQHDALSSSEQAKLMARGHPLIFDEESNNIITPKRAKQLFEEHHDEDSHDLLVGKHLDIKIGNHTLVVTIESVMLTEDEKHPYNKTKGYCWWTWEPDLRHIAIFNALVYFIATIIFEIPAIAWYPLGEDAPLGSVVFWVYVLQIIPSIGFVYVGFASMAEAAGSWFKFKLDSIGWWTCFFNMIGGWGFLLYAVLAIPGVVDPEGGYEDLSRWGASMATFWGSCCFFVAGCLACIEFASQHPLQMAQKKA